MSGLWGTADRNDLEGLLAYGADLVAAGFEVWHTASGFRAAGYLQYRDPATDCWGSLQYSLSEMHWQHLMPMVPSKEFGSSMFIQVKPARGSRPQTLDPWTVEAARLCARETNWNEVVGTQPNAKDKTWRSPAAVRL